MTIQIIRDQNNEIVTGNFCLYGSSRKAGFCFTQGYDGSYWIISINKIPASISDYNSLLNSLTIKVDGVAVDIDKTGIGQSSIGAWVHENGDKIRLDVTLEYTEFTVCGNTSFTLTKEYI